VRNCRKCEDALPEGEFARNTNRGKPIVTLCRLCVAEQAKLSFREKKFPAFVAELTEWPDVKLLSEAAWLRTKLKAIDNQIRRRNAT
jgi:hypothetical protein